MSARGGIDLGGTKIQAVVVDADNVVLGQARRPTPAEGGPSGVVEAMSEAMREAASEAGVETVELAGVGVGSPGDVDARAGTVSNAGNLPGWTASHPMAKMLHEGVGAPVRLGNDVQVATDAEAELGAGRPYDSLIGVFWGTGVGGGIVLDRRPWTGRGAGGEIGHVVVRVGGRRCPCGRTGCLEAYAGRRAMEARARELVGEGRETDLFRLMEKHGRDRLTSGIWARALRHGDELAEELLEEAVEALGAGIGSAVNLLDVQAVIIGGGLGVRLGEPYRARIEKATAPHLFTAEDPPAMLVAELGDLGGAIGAALLMLEPEGAQSSSGPGAGS